MKTVSSRITYNEKASRLELLVRIVYSIPIAIVSWFLNILTAIASVVMWFHILVFGRRHKVLAKFITLYMNYVYKVTAYLGLATDERPPIIPEED